MAEYKNCARMAKKRAKENKAKAQQILRTQALSNLFVAEAELLTTCGWVPFVIAGSGLAGWQKGEIRMTQEGAVKREREMHGTLHVLVR
jgi:hypothetical protein